MKGPTFTPPEVFPAFRGSIHTDPHKKILGDFGRLGLLEKMSGKSEPTNLVPFMMGLASCLEDHPS